MGADGWVVERQVGPAGVLHDASAGSLAGARRTARILTASSPAVVLGAGQPEAQVDALAAARAGIEVARRRSGGSAVLVGPGECVWVDVVIPREDVLWSDDVGRAAWWVGDAWVAALADCGLVGVSAWRGAFRRSPWSDRVCFAGLGPGEVLDRNGAKVVGVAQRRTRAGALFQCAALLRWRPADLLAVLAVDAEQRSSAAAELAAAAAACPVDADELAGAFVARLARC